MNKESPMKGDIVIVRAFGNVPLVRRVWDEDSRGVYVTDDERFERLTAGDPEILPPLAGFPREDVFKYDSKPAVSIDNPERNERWDWNRLAPY
jgi:hypothetical protein